MKGIRYGLAVLMLLAFLLVLVTTVIDVAILMDRSFFADQFEKNKIASQVHISQEDLMQITDRLLDYMKGKEDQLQLTVTVDGTERPFFSQRELEHMVDVRQMVLGAKQMRLVAAALLLLFFLFPKNRRAFLRIVPWGLGSLTAVFALAAWIISRDFTTAWWYFHVLLFSNELWILDPEVDLLVAIVPESFFAACAVRVGVGVVAGILLLWGGCVWWNRRQKRV